MDVPGRDGSGVAINNGGNIIGQYFNVTGSPGQHAFIYDKGTLTTIDVSGAFNTLVAQINDSGEVVGYTASYHGYSRHGFIYDKGTFTTIDAPGANFVGTSVVGINNHGEVVGNYTSGGGEHGYLYHKGAFTIIDVSGAASTAVSGINNRGEIVGNYIDNGYKSHGFIYDLGCRRRPLACAPVLGAVEVHLNPVPVHRAAS